MAKGIKGFQKGEIPWNKGMKMPISLRRKLSEIRKKSGIKPPSNLGLKRSEESKANYREARKQRKLKYGYINSPETREKISRAAKLRKGWKHSKETKQKIKLAHIGKIFSDEHKKNISVSKIGIKLSQKARYNIKISHLGKLNANWRGGLSFEPYGLEFSKELKEQVRKQDNYQCQECNFSQEQLGYKLSVHHIDYNKKNNSSDNLISLCKNCHSQTNFNRKDWVDYFKDKLSTVAS